MEVPSQSINLSISRGDFVAIDSQERIYRAFCVMYHHLNPPAFLSLFNLENHYKKNYKKFNFYSSSPGVQKVPLCGPESRNFGIFNFRARYTTKCHFFHLCYPSASKLQLLRFDTQDPEISAPLPGILTEVRECPFFHFYYPSAWSNRLENEKSQNFWIPGCRGEISRSQVTKHKSCKFQVEGKQKSKNGHFVVSQAPK